ncbi:MAG: GNAT family N-acetyltransferase [Candidatus Bathyarchaeota archaeon]
MVPYPKEFEITKKLKDGTEVLLRSIKPEDEPLWLEMFNNFSESSVWNRFFNIVKDPSHQFRARFCDINYENEIAIVAIFHNNGNKMLGVVRFTLDSDKKSGELAFIVADPWQDLGLGTVMVEHLINICRKKKIDTIYSFMLPNNYGAIRFLKRLNFRTDYSNEDFVKAFLQIK